jgi:hypothetical protein
VIPARDLAEHNWRVRGRIARAHYGLDRGHVASATVGGVARNGHVRFFYGPNAERKAARDRRRRA